MRRIVVIAVLLSFAVMAALPASAGLGNNPNADHITNLECEDGTTAPLIIAIGRAGHDPAGPAAGVALSLWVLDGENGTPVFQVYDVPGKGLENLTTWCWWFNPAEGLWVGGDILLHPSLR